MEAFATLLDRLVLTPQRNGKLRLMTDYFRLVPDPDRGYALAVLTGELNLPNVKPAMLRGIIAERIDEVLFGYSYDYVGDLAETIALAWPARGPPPRSGGGGPPPKSGLPDLGSHERRTRVNPSSVAVEGATPRTEQAAAPSTTLRVVPFPRFTGEEPRGTAAPYPAAPEKAAPLAIHPPTLSDIVERLLAASRSEGPRLVEAWLDELDATGRWALIKLVTGGLRIGVSARLTKQALADLGGRQVNEIEELWHGLAPPYTNLFAWLDGRGEKPSSRTTAPFRPVMLSHPLADNELRLITPEAYAAEWKWDGIRVQAVREGAVTRLYSRTGDDISGAFPDLVGSLDFEGAVDGELLIGARTENGFALGSFGDLQQRLNRKTVTEKHMEAYPAFLRVYDCLLDGADDIRGLPFAERRKRLEALVTRTRFARLDVSPLLPFADGEELAALRAAPPEPMIEGVMLKRWDSVYEPGRPKGPWFKWKRDPYTVDAVLMYAQRGHGKRSSYYSDYTFGVWHEGESGDELVPVGKAYFGFTDEELAMIDRFVRNNTVNRFGPVREVIHDAQKGLVLEVAFEGLQRSTRHRSGIAMRFPRISRLRWDKPPSEADRLETLEKLIRE